MRKSIEAIQCNHSLPLYTTLHYSLLIERKVVTIEIIEKTIGERCPLKISSLTSSLPTQLCVFRIVQFLGNARGLPFPLIKCKDMKSRLLKQIPPNDQHPGPHNRAMYFHNKWVLVSNSVILPITHQD